MTDKTAHHPDGVHTIHFREQYHTYIDNRGSRYVSGTSFIKPFFPKFDAIAVSEKCAAGNNPKYAGRTPQAIRDEWAAEGNRGSTEGDNTHLYAEGVISGWPVTRLPKPISDRCAKLFKQVDRVARWLLTKFEFVEAEKIVFAPELLLSGMVDLIMWDPATEEILILDWKQNKNSPSTENFFQSGYPPIDHLQETDINKYSLQLSLYQYLIIRENYFPQAKGYRRALIHLTPTAATPIKLDYFDYEVKEMLKCQKK